MRGRGSLGGWGLKEGDRAWWVGVVSSRKGGDLFRGWGLRKGGEDLLRGLGCWCEKLGNLHCHPHHKKKAEQIKTKAILLDSSEN